MNPIIIIGSGLAGYSVARELRKLDADVPLLMITADDGASYSKPTLSNAFAKGKTAETLVMASADKMAAQLNMQVLPRTKVTAIDTVYKQVFAGEQSFSYHKLVLAAGAHPVHPQIEGDAAADVLSVNSLADYAVFRDKLEDKHHIVILGGGLIGCEFANDLAGNGFRVSVVDRASEPLGRLLPEQIGRNLKQALVGLGVEWYPASSLKSIHNNNGVYRLLLADGHELMAEVVLSAIGLQANTDLAQAAGLTVDRAVVVNEYLQTSAPDVYALGDMAQVNGAFLPFIMPLMRCAKALASTLAGQETAVTYPAMPVMVKTPIMPLAIVPPAPGTEGEWRITEDNEGIEALYYDPSEKLKGFVLTHGKIGMANELASRI